MLLFFSHSKHNFLDRLFGDEKLILQLLIDLDVLFPRSDEFIEPCIDRFVPALHKTFVSLHNEKMF